MSIRTLSYQLQKKSETELYEVPTRVQDDLIHIKEWLGKQSHIKARIDDQWLLSFLRGCKFSLERTKEKLDMFYTMRTIIPEFFSNRDPFLPELQSILSLGCVLPLCKTDSTEPRILFIRNGVVDPDKHKFTNLLKINLMIMDILINEDDTFIIAGEHVLQDMTGMGTGHMFQMTPTLAKKFFTCIQEAYPVRPKGVHFTNIPPFFDTLYNMVRPLIKDKLKNRINIYSGTTYENLYDVIPKKNLPNEYGGEGGSLKELTDEWKKKVECYKDWFLEDAQFCTHEERRPGKGRTVGDVFGVDGSFRRMDVD